MSECHVWHPCPGTRDITTYGHHRQPRTPPSHRRSVRHADPRRARSDRGWYTSCSPRLIQHRLVPVVKGCKVQESFTCGNDRLDTWLQKSARPTGGEGRNRTYLWLDGETGDLRGYFTLAPTTVTDDSLLGTQSPAILLAKLAVANHLRGQVPKQGHALLSEAFRIAIEAADLIGGRYLAVDPQGPGLVHYYEELGFEVIDEESDQPQMLQKMSRIRAIPNIEA